MPSIQFSFSADGSDHQSGIGSVTIEAKLPRFAFKINNSQIFRYVDGYVDLSSSQDLDDDTYKVNLPLGALTGTDINDIYGFFLYHFIHILGGEQTQSDINDFSFKFTVTTKDPLGQLIASREFEGIYYLKSPYSSDFDRKYYQNEYAKFISTYGTISSAKKNALNERGLINLPEQYNRRVFIINKEAYEGFKYAFASSNPNRTVSDDFVLNFIQVMVDLNGDHPKLSSFSAGNVFEAAQVKNFFLVSEYKITDELGKYVTEHFDQLFDFPIQVPEIHSLEIGGELKIVTQETVSQADLDFYDLSVEYQQANGTPKLLRYNWSAGEETIVDNQIRFRFNDGEPLLANNISGPVSVRVKGYDGAVLWQEKYDKADETLQHLAISIAKYPAGSVEVDADTGRPRSAKRLRGKVLQNGDKYNLKDLTIVVQAKKDGDASFRIVTSAMTDQSGNFSLDYPYGDYTEAQALVSLMPNSPADLVIDPDRSNETISDDFIYLLLVDEEVVVPESDKAEEKDCDCKNPKKAKRLPDQADLIQSDEYTQDIGGSCINLSTPNRTLREYSYNAIVRVSDPEVANYVLKKVETDGRVTYNLEGGNRTLDRKEVDLNNPIRWEDAPDASENLSMYQAVTVATGHILYFKSVFKADGYSLGDLVYSLPLAPGQKKQIVVLESSHSLSGAESQTLAQGERLAAGLVSDRLITDQLSGGLSEDLSGRSKAHTSGMSVGLGASASYGGIGASLGVAGGFANSNSSASQNSARNISQFFGEKLRQTLMQNAESYRQLNASVVTTVTEGQDYGVTAETVANHNHCHSLTMMYFEVLRHYAIYQELAQVEECVFVPLLMTHFSTENIYKWKDILATNLLPIPSNTYLHPFSLLFRQHPLLKAFDANERIKTNYQRVDFPPEGATYADGEIRQIKGRFGMNVNIPRPKTKYDRIKSLPIITQVVTNKEFDAVATAKSFISPFPWSWGAKYKTTEEKILQRADIFDQFMRLDDNFQSVPPAQCIRVINFHPIPFSFEYDGSTFSFGISGADFFDGGPIDRLLWETYAKILGYTGDEGVYDMLDYYFKDRLIAEWDDIFNHDMLPLIFSRIVDSIALTKGRVKVVKAPTPEDPNHFELEYADNGPTLDLSTEVQYTGGNKTIYVNFTGDYSGSRRQLRAAGDYLGILCTNYDALVLRNHIKLNIGNVQMDYTTDYFHGTLFRGYVNDDLLDSTNLYIPLTAADKKDPRKEDEYLVNELITHLNSNLEHYNKVLWTHLDPDRRYMLLDGFNIQTYTSSGHKSAMRSLASVVKNELVTITGNALVFPVADGYRVGRNSMLEEVGENAFVETSLFDHYKPLTPPEPYRLSVPTRGVFMEAIQGSCDACEKVQENTSQDWDKFRTEEPTAISPIVTPTPTVSNYKPEYKDFAPPMVNIQNAPNAPDPGAGLAPLSELLGKAGIFNDITGLSGNQQNAMQTYKSNQENAKAFAEMSKSLATQKHNTDNGPGIADAIGKAQKAGYITEEDARELTRQHLQQLIDGGENDREAKQFEREQNRPSLTDMLEDPIGRGQSVEAQRRDADGTEESIRVGQSGGSQQVEKRWTVDAMTQPESPANGCWATVAAMMMNWKFGQSNPIETVLQLAGSRLTPPDENYYVNIFNSGTGLGASEKDRFVAALGMQAMAPANYTIGQYYEWLRDYGPLWVTIDANQFDGRFSPHALLLVGISGDLTRPEEVTFSFINPETGQVQDESFDEFLNLFEQMVTDSPEEALFPQIVRFQQRVSRNTEGQGSSSSPAWNVPVSSIVENAVQVGREEVDRWMSGGVVERSEAAIPYLTDYLKTFYLPAGAREQATAIAGGDSYPWSAVFISYLFLKGYIQAVVDEVPDATFDGLALSGYATYESDDQRTLLRMARTRLKESGIFEAGAAHARYITNSMKLAGNSMRLHDPATEPVRVGDFLMKGRQGSSYRIVNDRLSPASGLGHVDVVVDITTIDGCNFARLVGGNTTRLADKVAYKLRPLDSTGKLVLENSLADIPLDIVSQHLRDQMTAVAGSREYYTVIGVSGLSMDPHAIDYEQIAISKVEVIARL